MFAPLLVIAALSAGPVAGELSAPDVTVQYTERAAGAAPSALRRIQEEKAVIQRVLGAPGRITARLGAGREELEALALPGTTVPPRAAAYAYPAQGVMVLDALRLADPGGVADVRHELLHLALGEVGRFPGWFHEGLAMLFEGDGSDVAYYAIMYRGVQSGRIHAFEDLAGAMPARQAERELAYAQSASFAAFLTSRHGPEAFDELFQRVRGGEPFEVAFAKAFHVSIGSEEGAWRKTLERRYGTIPLVTLISLLWAGVAALCVLAFFRRQSDKERHLKAMDEELALEALLLAAAEPAAEPDERERPESEPPVIH